MVKIPPSSHQTSLLPVRVRRFVLFMAMMPIVPGVSGIGTSFVLAFAPALVRKSFGWATLGRVTDELWWFQLLFAMQWVFVTVASWRSIRPSTFLSPVILLVSLIAFLPVMYDVPLLLPVGGSWLGAEAARVSQFQLCIGIFTWVSAIVLRREEQQMTDRARFGAKLGESSMNSALISSVALQPVLFAVFLIFVRLLQPLRNNLSLTLALASAAVVGIGTWIIIWRSHIQWTPRSFAILIELSLICLVAPLLAQGLLIDTADSVFETLLWCLPVIGWGTFMAGTVSLWPSREPAVSSDGPLCLKCGYSLRGLKATRCPECGNEPTLDQLWRADSS